MNKKLIGIIRLAVTSLFLATLVACANPQKDNSQAMARKAQQDAAKALKAAEEAKAAAEAAQTEKERVDRMFEQTMKK